MGVIKSERMRDSHGRRRKFCNIAQSRYDDIITDDWSVPVNDDHHVLALGQGAFEQFVRMIMSAVSPIPLIGSSGADSWSCLRPGWDKRSSPSACLHPEERVKEKFFEYDGLVYYY